MFLSMTDISHQTRHSFTNPPGAVLGANTTALLPLQEKEKLYDGNTKSSVRNFLLPRRPPSSPPDNFYFSFIMELRYHLPFEAFLPLKAVSPLCVPLVVGIPVLQHSSHDIFIFYRICISLPCG